MKPTDLDLYFGSGYFALKKQNSPNDYLGFINYELSLFYGSSATCVCARMCFLLLSYLSYSPNIVLTLMSAHMGGAGICTRLYTTNRFQKKVDGSYLTMSDYFASCAEIAQTLTQTLTEVKCSEAK